MSVGTSYSPFSSISLKLIRSPPQLRSQELLVLVDNLTHWTYLYPVGENGVDDQLMNMVSQTIAYEFQQPVRQAARSYFARNHMKQLSNAGRGKAIAENNIMRAKLADIESQLREIHTDKITYAQLHVNTFEDPWLQMSPFEALRGYKYCGTSKESPIQRHVEVSADVLAKRSALNRYRGALKR